MKKLANNDNWFKILTDAVYFPIQQATNIATRMVKDLGMSDRVGLRTFEDNSGQIINTGDSLGQSTKEAIDTEIKRLLQVSQLTVFWVVVIWIFNFIGRNI